MIYQWSKGTHLNSNAQIVGERLESIRSINKGKLTPDAVVEDARDSRSPLHKEFEWNDKAAAEAHRVTQAKYIIRSVVMITGAIEAPIRAFVSIVQGDDQYRSYTHIVHAMSKKELRDQVLEEAKNALVSWHYKYENLKEFAKIHKAIKSLV